MKKFFKIILSFSLIFSFLGNVNADFSDEIDKVGKAIKEVFKKNEHGSSHSKSELGNEMAKSITGSNEKIISDTRLESVFDILKKNILNLVYIIVISALVWIGIRMASARGNPDEFKKAWIHFVYLLVGIFFIFAAVGIVKIIYSLNFFS